MAKIFNSDWLNSYGRRHEIDGANKGKNSTGLSFIENTGYNNAGNWNTGNRNDGSWNTGNRNDGSWNSGNWNSGDSNTGSYNTGDYNTGDYNTGDWNSGNSNTGNRNTGNYNTGDWNTASFSSGVFNTEETKILMFNKPSDWTYEKWINSYEKYLLDQMPMYVVEWIHSEDMSDVEKSEHPTHETAGGYLKILDESEYRQIWWNGLSDEKKSVIRNIPNFDKEIFEQITKIKIE